MATVWEQLQEKRKKVEELKALYKTTHTKAMADGELSDQEKSDLAQIDGGVKQAETKVKALEDEFKANKKKWEGRVKDYSDLQSKNSELFDWGDPMQPKINEMLDNVGNEARDMAWLRAIGILDNAINVVKGPYAEYTKQKPFEETYNKTHDGIEELGKDCAKSHFIKKKSIGDALTSFNSTMKGAADSAGNKKYDDACRQLDAAKATADDIKNDIDECRTRHQGISIEIASVKGEAALYATSKFKTVQALNTKMSELMDRVGAHLEEFNYDLAEATLKNARREIGQMQAEQEKMEKEEADWKAKEPAIQEAQKKAAEIKEFEGDGAADIGTGLDSAGKKAADEHYKEAADQADQTTKEVDEAHKKMQEEKKKKEEAAKALDDMKQKVGEVGESAFKTIKEAAKSVSDGAKDAEKSFEEKQFDAVKQKAKEIAGKAAEVAKEVAKLVEKQKEWEQKKPDLAKVEEEIKQLIEWGIKEAEEVAKKAQDAAQKAKDEAFDEAIQSVEDVKKAVVPLIEKLDSEKRAELIYKGLKAAFDAQMQVIRQGRYAAHQAVKLVLDQVEKIVDPIAGLVDEKQFEKATEIIQSATEKLGDAMKELARLEGLEKEGRDTLRKAKDKIAEAEGKVFETLKDTATAVKNAAAEVERQLEDVDSVEDAANKAKELVGQAVDYAKRSAEKAAEKAGWDKKESEFDTVKKMVDGLKATGKSAVENLRNKVSQVADQAKSEAWASAAGQVDALKSQAQSLVDEEEEEEAQMAAMEEEEEMMMAAAKDIEKEVKELLDEMRSA